MIHCQIETFFQFVNGHRQIVCCMSLTLLLTLLQPRNSLSLADTEPKQEMEPITEEDTPPNSAHSLGDELTKASDKLMDIPPGSQSESSSSPTRTNATE
jgi:hypothetical protein